MHDPLILCLLYHPPNLLKTQKNSTIDHLLSTASKLLAKHTSSKFIICGDFNDLDTSPLTMVLPLHQLVDFPTRGNHTLDRIFTDCEEYLNGCEKQPAILHNDHCSISLTPHGYRKCSTYRSVLKHDITPSAKIKISEELSNVNWSFISSEDCIDKKVELFQSFMTNVFDKHCPVRTVRVTIGKPCLTSPLIRKLSRAKKRAHNKGNPSWKSLSSLLKFHQKQLLSKQTDGNVNFAIKGSKNWWQNIKHLTGESKKTQSAELTYINDEWITDSEFANKMNEYLGSFSKPTDFSITAKESESSLKVEEHEVYFHLKNLDTSKSTISEDYPTWITKHNADILAEPVANIINSILKHSTFPLLWKRAEVIPIPKICNPTSFKNFRPISLLFHLSKTTERIVAYKIKAEVPSLENQFAYTTGRGVEDALVTFVTKLVSELDNQSNIGVRTLLLDFSKAFDRMKPDKAVERLIELGINRHLVQLIQSFFIGREQRVKFRKALSCYKSITTGVPQGTVLGPLLWNAFIHALQPASQHLKYADDITIYSAITKNDVRISESTSHKATITEFLRNPLQDDAVLTLDFCQQNDLSLNIDKSCSLTFTLQKELTIPSIILGSSAVTELKSSRILGVQFDRHLRFSEHITKILERTKTATHALTLLRRSNVRSDCIALFYKSRILSILSFACPVWYPYLSQTEKERLENFQSLCTRIILPDVDDYDSRLSILKLEELRVHLDILCLRYVSKVRSNEDHVCYNLTSLANKTGRTTFSDKILFKLFT